MATGKRGDKGRFVTLRSGRRIFIPEGKRTKWADVRDRIKAERSGKKEYFVGAWVNRQGHRYKITSNAKSVKSTANLYIDGEFKGVYPSRKEAKRAGRGWK